jgi:hypothetical protein
VLECRSVLGVCECAGVCVSVLECAVCECAGVCVNVLECSEV